VKYRIAAFDFDGTLADTLPWLDSIIDDVADRYGFRKPTVEDRAMLRHRSAQEIIGFLRIPLWKLPAIMLHVRERMQDISPDVQLFPGMGPALAQLRAAGVALAVVSSNSLANVQRVLGPEVCALFDDYECGTDVFGKPAKIRRLLERRAVPADQLILIGDELRDIEAARQAGVPVGCVGWGYNPPDVLRAQSPDLIFLSVADLPAQLA